MSQHQPADDLIAPRVLSRYRQIGVIPGWNRERFIKLCALANRVPEEIGAMAGLTPARTRTCLEQNLFPPPVSLHLAVFEAAIREAKYGEPWEPVVPMNWLKES